MAHKQVRQRKQRMKARHAQKDVQRAVRRCPHKEEFLDRLHRLERVVFPVPVIVMVQTDAVFEQAYQRRHDAPVRRTIRFRELEAL